MAVTERIRNSPSLRQFYHILVGTELRKEVEKIVNRKILQPMQNFGERLTYGQMIPLGPNGIKVVNPNLFMTTLGPNGNPTPPSTPPSNSKPKLELFTTVKEEEAIKSFQKPKVSWKEKLAYYGIPAAISGALAFFFPFQLSAIAISPMLFYGLGSGLLPTVLLPNVLAGLIVGSLFHLGARAIKRDSIRTQILESKEPHKFAWVLVQIEKATNSKLPGSLRKLIKEFEKKVGCKDLFDLARSIQSEPLGEKDKHLLYELLALPIPQEKKEEASKFLKEILDKINQADLKDRMESKINELTPAQKPSPSRPKLQEKEPTPETPTQVIVKPQLPVTPEEIEEAKSLGLYFEGKNSKGETQAFVIVQSQNPSSKQLIPNGELIGRGGMAEVYKGKEVKTGTPVAVKVVDLSKSQGTSVLKPGSRSRIEAVVGEQIESKHVVEVYAHGEMNNLIFIAMEYLSGPTLDQVIQKNKEKSVKFESKKAANWIIQVLEGIEAAHKLGIIHRDLKPANLFLEEKTTRGVKEELIVISDFGLAKVISDEFSESLAGLTHVPAVMGTFNYISPESYLLSILNAAGKLTDEEKRQWFVRTDLYAIGKILYELLTNTKPFDVSKFEDLMAYSIDPSKTLDIEVETDLAGRVKQIKSVKPKKGYQTLNEAIEALFKIEAERIKKDSRFQLKKPEGVPEGLFDIIQKAIFYDPRERYQSASKFKEDLENFLKGKEPEASEAFGKTTAQELGSQDLIPISVEETTSTLFAGSREKILQDLDNILLGNERVEDPQKIMETLVQLLGKYASDEEIKGKIWDVIDLIKPRS